jgi:hypothetical protein
LYNDQHHNSSCFGGTSEEVWEKGLEFKLANICLWNTPWAIKISEV